MMPSTTTTPRFAFTTARTRVPAALVGFFVLVANAPRGTAQPEAAATSAPAFEFDVASVKLNNSSSGQSKISGATPGRFVASNTPLRFLILYAYELLDHQLAAAPDWTSSVSFDIAATYPPGISPTDRNVRLMVQKLLSDRFGLIVHREQREMQTYALILARKDGRLGPQIRKSDVDCEQWIADKRPQIDAGGPSAVAPSGKRPACRMVAARGWLAGGTRTMAQLATTLQSMVGRPVVDQTGLTGAFDVDLRWTPREVEIAPDAESSNESPSIFTAVQEQLGLKLDSRRNRFDVLVVDHIARPTPN
jgi:uncharacterized protein (TIGR03435 family)